MAVKLLSSSANGSDKTLPIRTFVQTGNKRTFASKKTQNESEICKKSGRFLLNGEIDEISNINDTFDSIYSDSLFRTTTHALQLKNVCRDSSLLTAKKEPYSDDEDYDLPKNCQPLVLNGE